MEEVSTVEGGNGKRPHSTSVTGEESSPPLQRRRCGDLRSWRDLPDSFTDHELTLALNGETNFPNYRKFPLVCGLLIKLRSGYQRVYGRSNNRFPRLPAEEIPQQYYDAALMFCSEPEKLRNEWEPASLWYASEVITVKSINVDIHLQREIYLHPVYPFDAKTGWPCFHKEYLVKVKQYHDSLRRPDGTFTLPESDLIHQLIDLPRMVCPNCNHGRHVYCGPCGGLRMPNAVDLLPPRVELPFNVHLVFALVRLTPAKYCRLLPSDVDAELTFSWCRAESLMKCTGIHAAVFSEEGTTTHVDWKKEDETWNRIVESWDPEVDVLLFPYADSIPADQFPWEMGSTSAAADETGPKRKRRLLVLEASWQHAKAMSQRIVDHRKAKGLPPIPSVILTDVTGEYWRFQTVGQSAVSTVEAIVHTARAAGASIEDTEHLLTMFKVQKYRVLKSTETRKTPRAIEVAGVGIGSWKETCYIDEDGHIGANKAYESK